MNLLISNQKPIGRIIQLPNFDFDEKIDQNKIAIATGSSIRIFGLDELSYFKSESNYTHVHLTSGENLLTCITLKRFENKIDENQFLRVHNSYIINGSYISSYDSSSNTLFMRDGREIPVSRSRKQVLLQYLKPFMV